VLEEFLQKFAKQRCAVLNAHAMSNFQTELFNIWMGATRVAFSQDCTRKLISRMFSWSDAQVFRSAETPDVCSTRLLL